MKRSSYIKMLFIVSMLTGILAVATGVYATPVVTNTVTADVSSFINNPQGFRDTVTDVTISTADGQVPGSNTYTIKYNWDPFTNPSTYPLTYSGTLGYAEAGASLTATTATPPSTAIVYATATDYSWGVSAYSRIAIAEGSFYASTSGNITFSVPYSFDINLSRADTSEYCQANAYLSLNLYNFTTNVTKRIDLPLNSNGEWYFHGATSGDLTMNFNDSGTATVTNYFNLGDGIDFSLDLNTTAYALVSQNAVPIPGTVLLLGSGLLSLGAWRRLRKG